MTEVKFQSQTHEHVKNQQENLRPSGGRPVGREQENNQQHRKKDISKRLKSIQIQKKQTVLQLQRKSFATLSNVLQDSFL